MSFLPTLDDIFFRRTGLDKDATTKQVQHVLQQADDGELFLEYTASESLSWDDGKLKNASYSTALGFGLRGVFGEANVYAHASEISKPALLRAGDTILHAGFKGTSMQAAIPPRFGSNRALYDEVNPLQEMPLEEKLRILQEIDQYLRAKDERVKQVSASISGQWQAIEIMRGDGLATGDIRPLVRIGVSVIVEENGRRENGSSGAGARRAYKHFIAGDSWQSYADEALRQALVNLESVSAPAGEMPVVLGPGWCGVLLHEAIGHGLEGDFNRKETSAFTGMIGKQVAARGVTIVDDGTIDNVRGSLTIDDEGTPTSRTILIEDGILVGYINDRLNARLMGMRATGNGRRESFAHAPMPRMTNTFMLGGNATQSDLIASVKNGIYAAQLGGGQVDITSGKFVFSASEAYMIEDGKITAPIKGVSLIGNGPECLKHVKGIANDMCLDPGVGTCGKDGQSVPVGVGQPSMLIEGLTVGGTR